MSQQNILRAALAADLSQMYADEVPKYGHLVDATQRVNQAEGQHHLDPSRLGTERHGAIRVASFDELGLIARLFAQFGMQAVGYYDLRTGANPIPVVSTAFRPVTTEDLDASPFRMFTSVLVADDDQFFTSDMQAELGERMTTRQIFSDDLLTMIEAVEQYGHVDDPDQFVALTVDAFRLDPDPIDREWFEQLDEISPVASDIAAGRSTHLNHLTPRVADIAQLHATMEREGVTMIDRIQGPPTWDGPDLLLRQTSFRALDETRTFRRANGDLFEGTVRVRFGEVEQRGIAVTPQGRAKVDAAMQAGNDASSETERENAIRDALNATFPTTIVALYEAGDIYARHVEIDGAPSLAPITYEDFLPASAAGIFASNLAHAGVRVSPSATPREEFDRLRAAVGHVHDPYVLYQAEQERSQSVA